LVIQDKSKRDLLTARLISKLFLILIHLKGSKPDSNTDPGNVWSIITPEGVSVRARVAPIPEGLELKDVAEKWYLPKLKKFVGTGVWMDDNKEITLSDGTKAYYSQMVWDSRVGVVVDSLRIVSMVVFVFKDGKLVNVAAHPWNNFSKSMEIVKSLKFQ
jgi:hypothetical protein